MYIYVCVCIVCIALSRSREILRFLGMYVYIHMYRSLAASLPLSRDLALSLFLCVFPRLGLVELSRSLSRASMSLACSLTPSFARLSRSLALACTRSFSLSLSFLIPPLRLRARAISLDLSPRVTSYTAFSTAPTLKRALPSHTYTQNLGCQELENLSMYIFSFSCICVSQLISHSESRRWGDEGKDAK